MLIPLQRQPHSKLSQVSSHQVPVKKKSNPPPLVSAGRLLEARLHLPSRKPLQILLSRVTIACTSAYYAFSSLQVNISNHQSALSTQPPILHRIISFNKIPYHLLQWINVKIIFNILIQF